MPANTFIKFMDAAVIPGESMAKTKKGTDGYIDCLDWSWSMTAESSVNSGGGAAVGKPKSGTVSFNHAWDTAAPVIFQKIVRGQHFSSVVIEQLKNDGSDEQKTFFMISMKDVFITKASVSGGEDGAVKQGVEMVAKEIYIGYKAQEQGGKLESTPREFSWNIPTMKSDVALSEKLK